MNVSGRVALGTRSLARDLGNRYQSKTANPIAGQSLNGIGVQLKEAKGTENPESKEEKTIMQRDRELMEKMAGLSGDGGASGVEYEDGKPVAMKRGVRENMFRYI